MFGRGSRASSFTVTATPGGRTENDSLEGGALGVLLVEEQSGCNRIPRVYSVWLWLLTEATLDSTGLQSSAHVLEQTLTCSLHLHPPLRQTGSPWIEKDLWDGVSRGHVVHNSTISRFGAITITITCFVH